MKSNIKYSQSIAKPIALSILLFISISTMAVKPRPKALIFSKTVGYHHNSIATGIIAIQKLGVENKFEVDTTINAQKFTIEYLKQFKAVIFLSPTGDVLNG